MRILVIAAHPDDESGFGGGLLAKLADEGHEVYILETTRGEGGEVGDPPVGPKSRLGEFREVEMRCAAGALGAREVRFLDFVDPPTEIGDPLRPIDASLEEFASAIAGHLGEIRPEMVITHGSDGEYGHPQHLYTFRAVREALRRLSPWFPGEFLTWCANAGINAGDRLTNKSDPADYVPDISPWFERKVAAMECHRSQHAMFKRNSNVGRVRDMVRRVEAYRRWSREALLAQAPAEGSGEASTDWRVVEEPPGAQ